VTSLTIREIRAGDGEGCAQAWQDAGRYYASHVPDIIHKPQAEGLAEWFEQAIARPRGDDELWLAAEHDGQVIGLIEAAILHPSPDAHWQLQRDLSRPRLAITALAVTAARRRQGTGTALMKAAEAWGQSKGAIVAVTDTNLHSPLSVPFYEHRMGYHRQAVILRKLLL
jgi:GNAT superfamily N-acetyltransferase